MVRKVKKSYKKKSIKNKSMKNKSRKLKKISKKQKVYVMKGCSRCRLNCNCGPNCNCPHKCPGNCYLNKVIKNRNKKGGENGSLKLLNIIHDNGGEKPIAPLSWKQMNGGNYNYYDSASRTRTFKGGSGFYKQPANMPGPLIGQSWGGKINNWPSVDGVGSNRNYLENNLYNKGDPQTSMKLDYSNGFKGGASIVPQDLTNIGRMLEYNIGTAYNSLNGYSKPINPMPYNDQFNTKLNNNVKIPL